MTEDNAPDSDRTAECQPKRNLRRFARFNLKFFLVAVTLFCVWLAWNVQRTKAQKKAVQAFQEYGGWARYDYQFVDSKFDAQANSFVPSWLLDRLGIDFFHSVVEMNCVYTKDNGKREENSNYGSAPLEQLSGLPHLKALYFQGRQATNENMVPVGKLKHLVTFCIWGADEISDEGIAHLDGLHLENVHLSHSKITDESMRVFGKMKSLKRLTLQFNNVTDEGVKHLQQLENLESLWVCGHEPYLDDGLWGEEQDVFRLPVIDGKSVTDESLKLIGESFLKLKTLGVQSTQVTSEGVEALKAKLPACTIHNARM